MLAGVKDGHPGASAASRAERGTTGMNDPLSAIIWQVAVAVSILLAFGLAIGIGRRSKLWLRRRFRTSAGVAGLSAVGVGIGAFVVLTVLFGFVMDQTVSF